MFKIVPFEANNAQKNDKYGLSDLSNDTLATSNAGVVVLQKTPSGDWSNQEIASIYLAVRLLKGAGVDVESDRGVTDDGSPWCVFFNVNGDVVVHIARIDFAYILDGIGLDKPLKGKTFEDLIGRFVSGTADKSTSENLPKLSIVLELSKHRQTKVFIHPAAQLVALIWATMMIKDVVAANAGEIDWTKLPDESDFLLTNAVEPNLPELKGVDARSALEILELYSEENLGKTKDTLTTALQSLGILSVGYLTLAPEQISLEIISRLLIVGSEAEVQENATVDLASGMPDMLDDILSAIDLVTINDAVNASQEERAFNTGHVLSMFHANSVADIVGPLQKLFALDLGADVLTDDSFPSEFKHDNDSRTEQVRNKPDIVAPPNINNEPQNMTTVTDLLDYFADFDVRPIQGDEAFIADLLLISQDIPAVDSDGPMIIETRPNDADVIGAVIEFLGSSEGALTFYYSEGIHIIEQNDMAIGDLLEPLTLTWTFMDGSQIMIVGAATDLASLDLLI